MAIFKRPDGKYRATYRSIDAKQHSKHFLKKRDAERWLTEMQRSLHRGEWIDPDRASVTVGEWCDAWLATTQIKPTTRARYTGIIKNQIKPEWDAVPLSRVTPMRVAKWLADLSNATSTRGVPFSAASVRYAHRVLFMALALAVKDGRILRNPAHDADLPKVQDRRKRFLTAPEVWDLAEECGEYGDLVLFLAYTGLRWGEVSALRVCDIDLLRKRVTVERAMAEVGGRAIVGTPKNHQIREIGIPPYKTLTDALMRRMAGRAGSDLLFPAPEGGFLRNGNFRKRFFDRAAERAGLVGVTPHGLRHTAASLAIAAGATVKVVQAMLGHEDGAITLRVYAHLFAGDLDALAEQMSAVAESAERARVTKVLTKPRIVDLRAVKPQDQNAV